MRKTIALLLAAGTIAAPAAALAAPAAHPNHHAARTVSRQACKAQRQLLGKTAFRVKYGATKAERNCVKGVLPSARTAAKTCRTERKTLGPAAFKAKYGGPSALNRCIKVKTTTP
jgi:hypothetical protein